MNGHANRQPHVAIIGAGVSGLRCADVLLQCDAEVTIFEARDRLGGRLHQIETGGHLVDLGANWIHEPNNNPVLQLAKETNTITFERPKGQATFDRNGERFSDDIAVRLKSTLWDVVGEAEEYSLQHRDAIDPCETILDYVRNAATKQYHDEPDFAQSLIDESERLGQFFGDPINTMSLKFACIEEGGGGADLFLASTYKDILDLLKEKVDGRCTVRLNAEVIHVQGRTETSSKLCLTTSDGTKEGFDEVVVSCPLGYLKKVKDTMFSPALPGQLSAAIDHVRYGMHTCFICILDLLLCSYGRLEKLYITFPSAFWKISSDETTTATAEYPCFTHFHDPTYGKHPPGLPSNAIVISLAHLPAANAHPTLLFYLHGPCGAKVAKSVRDFEADSDEYNQAIDSFARPYYSLLPNFSKDDQACQPKAWFASAWQQDRLAGYGSYSNIQIPIENAIEDVEALQTGYGFGDQHGIWLIGEHTAPPAMMATTTGAYVSGERGARRICDKWKLTCKES